MSLPAACATGRFVPHFRNRAIGRESVRLRPEGEGWRLSAETEIAVNRLVLSQRLEAVYGPGLAPEWCIVEGRINSRPMSLQIEIDGQQAVLRSRSDRREGERCLPLRHLPLLLPDNAFASHALAALAALDRVGEGCPAAGEDTPAAARVTFTALPAGEVLEAARGAGGVLLGGREFPPPALSLRLMPGLEEHVWLSAGWVGRLVVPQAQMRVEWESVVET